MFKKISGIYRKINLGEHRSKSSSMTDCKYMARLTDSFYGYTDDEKKYDKISVGPSFNTCYFQFQ